MALEINGLPPASGTGPTNKTTALPPLPPLNQDSTEPVQLSKAALALQNITEHLTQESAVDMNKVEAYRQAIAKGSYVVNTEAIAQQLLRVDGFF